MACAVLAVLGLVSGSGLAAPRILVPVPTVSPEGVEVQLEGGVGLTARGASVAPIDGVKGRFRVVPAPGEASVELRSGDVVERVPVGPPAAEVGLRVTSRPPVKGRDTSVEIQIDLGSSQALAPPVVRANVGRIEGLKEAGAGRYTATYVLPTTRYPEVAVLVAFAAWPHAQSVHGAVGALRLPLPTFIEVPGRTEANAQMSMTVGGQTFGPTQAGPDGSFRLPVVVPPGHSDAMGLAVDRLGNRRRVKFDLRIPPTDQLACVMTPTRLPADGVSLARILCATSDRFGGKASGAGIKVAADRGVVSAPRELGGGVTEWTLTAPTDRGAGSVQVRAIWKQGKVDSREELELSLGQGPVAKAEFVEPPALVHAGGRWRFSARATDGQGRPLEGVRFRLNVPRDEVTLGATDAQGRADGSWRPAKTRAPGALTVQASAWGPTSDEPAEVRIRRVDGAILAEVTDLSGLPVPGQPLRLGDRTVTTGADGTVLLGALPDGEHQLTHARWPGLAVRLFVSQSGAAVFPLFSRAPETTARAQLTVAPPAPVVVRLEAARGEVVFWVESADGEVVDGRALEVQLGDSTQRLQSKGRTRLEVGAAVEAVTVVDVESRVLAAAQVPR